MGIEVADENSLGEKVEAMSEGEMQAVVDNMDLMGILQAATRKNPIVDFADDGTVRFGASHAKGEVEIDNPAYEELPGSKPGSVEVGTGVRHPKKLIIDGKEALVHILKTTVLPLATEGKDECTVGFSFGGRRHKFTVTVTKEPDGHEHVWTVVDDYGDIFCSGFCHDLPQPPKTTPVHEL